jgi:hypothetical protein
MDHKVIAAAAAGASRGMIEYELRSWPVAAAAAGLGLSLAVRALPIGRKF